MKTRAEAAEFVCRQLLHTGEKTLTGRDKPTCHHYGKQELRELLDYIYEAPPVDVAEKVF
jgi:hypothetical protein